MIAIIDLKPNCLICGRTLFNKPFGICEECEKYKKEQQELETMRKRRDYFNPPIKL